MVEAISPQNAWTHEFQDKKRPQLGQRKKKKTRETPKKRKVFRFSAETLQTWDLVGACLATGDKIFATGSDSVCLKNCFAILWLFLLDFAPTLCRADLGWIFSFGPANFGKIAREFLSEFWWRILIANFSALFFQAFRPPQKVHAQNSRPELSAFLSNFTFLNPNVLHGDFLLTGETNWFQCIAIMVWNLKGPQQPKAYFSIV